MSLCKIARTHMGVTQEKFAAYISEQSGFHVRTSLIGKYESSHIKVCEKYSRIMLPLACESLAKKITQMDRNAPDFKDRLRFILADVLG